MFNKGSIGSRFGHAQFHGFGGRDDGFGSRNWNGGGWSLLGDDGNCVGIGLTDLGLGLPLGAFERVVNALIDHPIAGIAAGENAATSATSNLFWAYNKITGLTVEAAPGFLSTATGNGGFDLNVLPDGSWSLTFDGTHESIGHNAHSSVSPPVPPQPAGNTVVYDTTDGAVYYDASAGDTTYDGQGSAADPVVGFDTVTGGAGDYMIGGTEPRSYDSLGLANGDCALYSSSPGSVLVDMENGAGYGSNAEGNLYDNMNQVRGSLFSNVLIGATTGTDLKSGGNDSLLVSTGGNGYELRPDGSGNVLVSTVGADRVLFDPTHGWVLGDQNVMLGFNAAHGDFLDLTLLGASFNSLGAMGCNPATGTGNINDYVRIVDESDGDHVMFNAAGHVQTAGVQLVDLLLDHGLTAQALYNSGNLVI